MDKYYGNVCELDIIFNFQKAYFILDELLLAGEMQESSKKNVLRCIGQQDSLGSASPHTHSTSWLTRRVVRLRTISLPRLCKACTERTITQLVFWSSVTDRPKSPH